MVIKTILGVIALLLVAFLLYLMFLGKTSKNGSAPGLVDGMLSQCPGKPNCVCSEYPDATAFYIEPISFTGTTELAMTALAESVTSAGGEVVKSEGSYLSATFTSALFGFVDDVEFRVDTERQIIHVRSASRVGHSDMNANRKRIEAIQVEFSARRG